MELKRILKFLEEYQICPHCGNDLLTDTDDRDLFGIDEIKLICSCGWISSITEEEENKCNH